jgi:Ca2+-binding EF-hand superfamily protein
VAARPPPPTSSFRTASPPASPAPERFSAAPGRDATRSTRDPTLDHLVSDLSSLRREISDERKHRMELQEKLQECLTQSKAERQSFSAASAELQTAIDEVDARRKGDFRAVEQLAGKVERIEAQVLSLTNDASETQNSMHIVMDMLEGCIDGKEARELVAGCMGQIEKSEAVIGQHMEERVAAMTEEIKTAEAKTLETLSTAIEGIETMETKLEQHVAEIDTELEALKQGASKTAAEAGSRIESLGAQTQADKAELVQRFNEINPVLTGLRESTERNEESTARNEEATKRNADRVSALRILQQLIYDEDTKKVFETVDLNRDEKISKHEMKQGLMKMNHKVSDSELDELWELLDTDNSGDINYEEFAVIGQIQEGLDDKLSEVESQIGHVESALTDNLSTQVAEIQLVVGKVGAQSEEGLGQQARQLEDILAQVNTIIQKESQQAATANERLDAKYQEACDQLRTLLTHMDAAQQEQLERVERQTQTQHEQANRDYQKQLERVEKQAQTQHGKLQKDIASTKSDLEASTKSDLIHESEDIRAQLTALSEKFGHVIEEQGAKFGIEMSSQSEKFLDDMSGQSEKFVGLVTNIAKTVDEQREALEKWCVSQLKALQDEHARSEAESVSQLKALQDKHARSEAETLTSLNDQATRLEQQQRELERVPKQVERDVSEKLDNEARERNQMIEKNVQSARREIEKMIIAQSATAQSRADDLDKSIREMDKDRETAGDQTSGRIDAVHSAVEELKQSLGEVCENFESQLKQVEDEVHAVHQSKCDELESSLGDLQESTARNAESAARNADRVSALRILQQLIYDEDTKGIFQKVDLNRDKKISKHEMKQGLMKMNHKVSDSELDELWELLDTDDSGDINYEEFAVIGQIQEGLDDKLTEFEIQAAQRLEAVHAELDKHGASVQSGLADMQQEVASTNKQQQQQQQEAQSLALAYEKSQEVKTELQAQVSAEQSKNRELFERLRGEISSVESQTTKLSAKVSGTEASIKAAAETSRRDLDSALRRQESKASEASQRLERDFKDKLGDLGQRHDSERQNLAAKVEGVASKSAADCRVNADAIEALRTRYSGTSEVTKAARDESEKRLQEVATAMQTELRERSEKLEHQLQAATADQQTAEEKLKGELNSTAERLEKQV